MASPQRPREAWVMYPQYPADGGLDALSLKAHRSRNTRKTLADELAEYENQTATLSVSPPQECVDRNVPKRATSNLNKRVKARIGGRWLQKANTNIDGSLSSQVGLDQHSMTDNPCSAISLMPPFTCTTKQQQGGILAVDVTDQKESEQSRSVPKTTFQTVHLQYSTVYIVLMAIGLLILWDLLELL